MSEYNLSDQPLDDWTAHDVGAYLKTRDLGDYSEMFESNNVTGSVAHTLTDSDLKEMGVDKIGDRKALLLSLNTLKKAQKHKEAEKVIWEGEEVLFFSCWDQCCGTCCGCCPEDPSQYKLMANHLEIKTVNPCRCGPIMCCFGATYEVDNIDLSNIIDTDVQGIPAPCLQECCCGGKLQEHVHIKTNSEGEKVLKLPQGEGQDVARKIKNQVEAMQRMERS